MGIYFIQGQGFDIPTLRHTNSLFKSHAETAIIASYCCHFLNYQSIA